MGDAVSTGSYDVGIVGFGPVGATLGNLLGFRERWLVIDLILRHPRPDWGDFSVQFCDPARPATYVRGTGNRRR